MTTYVNGVPVAVAPAAHKASHQNGGGDEVSVAALSGLLADDQHVLDAEAVSAVEAAGLALASGKNIKLISALAANQTWSGLTAVLTAGENLTIGQACYMKDDGKMYKSLATVVGTMPIVALATGTIDAEADGEFLLLGFFREDTVFTFTIGDMLYASEDTAGALKNAAPTTAGEQVQVCGKCFPSVHVIFFNPSLELVEIAA